MWRRKVSIILICLGVTVVTYNIFLLVQGYFVYSEPTLSVEDFEMEPRTPLEKEIRISNVPKAKKNLYKITPKVGEKIGELTIPKLERTLPIFHGTSTEVLKKGVGHLEKSALPGEDNNSILSGHRDTVFYGLGDVGVNDEIIVSTSAGDFLYKVKKIRIVDKDDHTVIVPKPKSTITITTCYPFHFVGEAPQRYILVGELISKNVKL